MYSSSAWLLSLDIMFSGSSVFWCILIACFFLLLSNGPLYVCTPTGLLIFLLLDIWVVFIVWLLWINMLWPSLYKSFWEHMHAFLVTSYRKKLYCITLNLAEDVKLCCCKTKFLSNDFHKQWWLSGMSYTNINFRYIWKV